MTITYRRNRLATEAIEAVECIHGCIKDGIPYYVDISMEGDVLEGKKGVEKARSKEAEGVMIIDVATEFG